MCVCVCLYVRACARARVCVCVRARVCVCVCVLFLASENYEENSTKSLHLRFSFGDHLVGTAASLLGQEDYCP